MVDLLLGHLPIAIKDNVLIETRVGPAKLTVIGSELPLVTELATAEILDILEDMRA